MKDLIIHIFSGASKDEIDFVLNNFSKLHTITQEEKAQVLEKVFNSFKYKINKKTLNKIKILASFRNDKEYLAIFPKGIFQINDNVVGEIEIYENKINLICSETGEIKQEYLNRR